MNVKEAKEELNSYRYDLKMIKNKEREIEEYRNKATSCTSVLSDMPKGSPTQDKVSKYACMIADKQAEIYDDLIATEEHRKLIEDTIKKLDPIYKDLLYDKYINGISLTEIANQMPCAYRHICRLHEQALLQYIKTKEVI